MVACRSEMYQPIIPLVRRMVASLPISTKQPGEDKAVWVLLQIHNPLSKQRCLLGDLVWCATEQSTPFVHVVKISVHPVRSYGNCMVNYDPWGGFFPTLCPCTEGDQSLNRRPCFRVKRTALSDIYRIHPPSFDDACSAL